MDYEESLTSEDLLAEDLSVEDIIPEIELPEDLVPDVGYYLDGENLLSDIYSHDYSDVESLVVEMFRADVAKLNQALNMVLIVGVILLIGWLVTLRLLKKTLKRQEALRKDVNSLQESLRLSQKMQGVKNGIILDDELLGDEIDEYDL